MQQHRIDPLGLLVNKISAETAGTPKAEVARMNNTVLGACPICAQSMQTLDVGGIACYVCLDDNVALPTKDKEIGT